MSTRSRIAPALLVLAMLGAPSLARAQDAHAAATKDDTYRYAFPDDPLAAGLFGPNDVQIRVVPKPKRVTLIRPRTQLAAGRRHLRADRVT
jgi:hypothetical protein